MASSGTVTLATQSVDYGGGRGAVWLYNDIGWNVDDSGNISFWSISSRDNAGGTWGICGSTSGYGVVLEPQISYDGTNWISLDSKYYEAAICPSLTNTIAISTTLIGQLGSYHLDRDCSLRFLYYANREPAPSPSLPNSFPSSSYSAAVQVPVHVDVSWTATLNYNANGGTGAPSASTVTVSGNTANITVSSTVPTRTNYRFGGWDTNSSATTASYHGGDTFTISKSDPTQTLYAVWEKYYHPGKIWNGSAWMSHDREPGGDARVKSASSWKDMRTIDAPTGKNDPPSIYHDDDWYNMRDIGTH